ncbi:MAG: hypothetical protein AAB652_01325 [Patescibacteria group bacterium]
MNKIIFVSLLALIALLSIWLFWPVPPHPELNQFAQCLSEKGVTMYGADWCPHCQNEKRAFGDSFRFVPYVECPKEPNRCIAAGINGYPTWVFADGTRFEGEQGIQKLSQKSGCPLGESKN